MDFEAIFGDPGFDRETAVVGNSERFTALADFVNRERTLSALFLATAKKIEVWRGKEIEHNIEMCGQKSIEILVAHYGLDASQVWQSKEAMIQSTRYPLVETDESLVSLEETFYFPQGQSAGATGYRQGLTAYSRADVFVQDTTIHGPTFYKEHDYIDPEFRSIRGMMQAHGSDHPSDEAFMAEQARACFDPADIDREAFQAAALEQYYFADYLNQVALAVAK